MTKTTLRIPVGNNGTITYSVWDEGSPCTGAPDYTGTRAVVNSVPQGEFNVNDGTLGNHSVRAHYSGGGGPLSSSCLFFAVGWLIQGTVFVDSDRDGSLDSGEKPVAGVHMSLKQGGLGVGASVADGSGEYFLYAIKGSGGYNVVQTQPEGYGSTTTNNRKVLVYQNVDNINFGESVGSIKGEVYVDADNDGVRDPGEQPIGGVQIKLSGATPYSLVIFLASTTKNGEYVFTDLVGGTYTLTETQPGGYMEGAETAGSAGGTPSSNKISNIVLPAAEDATGYLFGERKASAGGGMATTTPPGTPSTGPSATPSIAPSATPSTQSTGLSATPSIAPSTAESGAAVAGADSAPTGSGSTSIVGILFAIMLLFALAAAIWLGLRRARQGSE